MSSSVHVDQAVMRRKYTHSGQDIEMLFNALKEALFQHILPNPRYITNESQETISFHHYIYKAAEVENNDNDYDSMEAGPGIIRPIHNREDFKHVVEFRVSYTDTRFVNMEFGIQMQLHLKTGNSSENTLIVGMLRVRDLYFNIDNPLYFYAVAPATGHHQSTTTLATTPHHHQGTTNTLAKTAAMPQRAIDQMLKYFTFFIDEFPEAQGSLITQSGLGSHS